MNIVMPDLVLAAGTMQAFGLQERLDAARAAGFAGISLFAADLEKWAAEGLDAEAVGARIADAGLWISEVEIIGNWLPGASGKQDMPQWLVEFLQRMTPDHVLDLAQRVGARGVSIADLLGAENPSSLISQHFADICEMAAEAGLYVALEFIPTGSVPTLEAAWDVVDAAGARNGGLMIDSWHFFRGGSLLESLESIPGDRIFAVQIGDGPAAAEADLDEAMAHSRLLPGAGEMNLSALQASLAKTGTAAPVAVEVFSDAFAGRSADEVATECMRAAKDLIKGDKR